MSCKPSKLHKTTHNQMRMTKKETTIMKNQITNINKCWNNYCPNECNKVNNNKTKNFNQNVGRELNVNKPNKLIKRHQFINKVNHIKHYNLNNHVRIWLININMVKFTTKSMQINHNYHKLSQLKFMLMKMTWTLMKH